MVNAYYQSEYNKNESVATPSQLASSQMTEQGSSLNRLNRVLSGADTQMGGRRKMKVTKSKKRQNGGNRTFNVPVHGDVFEMPGATPNNAWYVGEPCVGNHCGISVTPSVSTYMSQALALGNDVVPGSTNQYSMLERLGNNPAELLPGNTQYTGTDANPGPFQLNCLTGGSRVKRLRNKKSKKKIGGCAHIDTIITCTQGQAYKECRDCHKSWRQSSSDHLCH